MLTDEEKLVVVQERAIQLGFPKDFFPILSTYALNILKEGRPDFDVPHSLGVTYWMTELVEEFYGNDQIGQYKDEVLVLITTALLHDIGYYGEFAGIDMADYATVHDKKEKHMLVGAEMARQFLSEQASQYLTEAQIDIVAYLISIHDKLDEITTEFGHLLVQADTLGMLDVDWVEPTYKGEEALGFLEKEKTKNRLAFLFETEFGQTVAIQIIAKFEQFVIDRDFDGVDPRVQ